MIFFSKRPSALTGPVWSYRVHTSTCKVHDSSLRLGVHILDSNHGVMIGRSSNGSLDLETETTVRSAVLDARTARRRPKRVTNAHDARTYTPRTQTRTQTPRADATPRAHRRDNRPSNRSHLSVRLGRDPAARRADERRRGGFAGRRAEDVDHGYGGYECGAYARVMARYCARAGGECRPAHRSEETFKRTLFRNSS